jgi:hypothetical protein
MLVSLLLALIGKDDAGDPGFTNWALASNGATASGSAYYAAGKEWASVNNGARHTNNSFASGNNCYVSSATPSGGSPVTIEIDFGATRSITEIDLFGLAEAVNYNTDPTLSDVGNSFKNIDFTIDYWNGSAWANLQTITGNNKVWRQFTFTSVSTTKIRFQVTNSAAANVYVAEIEAWG